MMTINLRKLLFYVLGTHAIGGLAGFITRNDTVIYKTLEKPAGAPPGIVFPIIWIILYTLMGISAYLVADSPGRTKMESRALTVYGLQLFFNFAWSIIFFTLQLYLVAFIWLIILWVLIVVMIISFFSISKPAALLQMPYLLWVSYAGYLNIGIYLLNR